MLGSWRHTDFDHDQFYVSGAMCVPLGSRIPSYKPLRTPCDPVKRDANSRHKSYGISIIYQPKQNAPMLARQKEHEPFEIRFGRSFQMYVLQMLPNAQVEDLIFSTLRWSKSFETHDMLFGNLMEMQLLNSLREAKPDPNFIQKKDQKKEMQKRRKRDNTCAAGA